MTWYALAMFISDKSDLEKLNFTPRSHRFTLARVEWKNVVLNPQKRDDLPLVDLSEFPLEDCLVDLFGPLSLVELFDLIQASSQHPHLEKALDKQSFFQKQGRQWNERMGQLFDRLTQTSRTFLDWAHNKQVGHREIQPLLSLKAINAEVNQLLDQFSIQKLSRNEGKQILDLLVDLLLMDHETSSLLPKNEQPWLPQLTQLRHPIAGSLQNPPPNLGWPKYVQVVNFRQGDRVLKKMQITYLDQDDLSQKLQRLSSVETKP